MPKILVLKKGLHQFDIIRQTKELAVEVLIERLQLKTCSLEQKQQLMWAVDVLSKIGKTPPLVKLKL